MQDTFQCFWCVSGCVPVWVCLCVCVYLCVRVCVCVLPLWQRPSRVADPPNRDPNPRRDLIQVSARETPLIFSNRSNYVPCCDKNRSLCAVVCQVCMWSRCTPGYTIFLTRVELYTLSSCSWSRANLMTLDDSANQRWNSSRDISRAAFIGQCKVAGFPLSLLCGKLTSSVVTVSWKGWVNPADVLGTVVGSPRLEILEGQGIWFFCLFCSFPTK